MLFSGSREQVLARSEGNQDPQDRVTAVADAVRSQLLGRGFADRATSEQDSLVRTALMVPDDLCVLAPSPEGYRLVGASLCSPSYWRLADKIGRSITGIHAPVSGLESALGPMMSRFFEKLPVGQVFARRNWNIHREAERFHPDPEVWDPAPDAEACGRLFVRTEFQTLRKFDNQALLFTIGVGSHRLAGIRHYPAAIDDLLLAIGAMSADERQAFGYRHHGNALCQYLRALRAL